MKKLIAAAVMIAALAGCTTAGPRDRRDLRPTANPSAVIATEIAFARAAQERGQWTAFRQYATRDAVMFVPEPVNAQDWLRRQADPPQAVRWQPHQVWSSCDGTLAVTRGAWQRPDGSVGYFTTVWQRQERGDYRWVVDQGDTLAEPLAAPDMLSAEVADCSGERTWGMTEPVSVELPTRGSGRSRDRTLVFEWDVDSDLSRRLTVSMMKDGEMVTVLESSVAAPAG